MPVTTEDVHVALRVNDANVAISGGWFSAPDKSKFVLVRSCVGVVALELSSLLHLLVVLVEALIGILDDEGVHHGDGGG